MTTGKSFAALQLAAVAAVSVLVGHWAGYVIAVPNATVRETVLLDSGHVYWMLAVKLALLLGVTALAASAFDALRRGLDDSSEPQGWTPGRALLSLAITQVGCFIVLEVSERLLSGEPLSELSHHGVFAWGLIAQLAVAPIGAALLTWLGRALRKVARARARPLAPTSCPVVAVAWPALDRHVPARDWRGAFATRGPPL